MERMGLSSERFRAFLTVFSIAFPLLFIVTLMYQNSSFHLFEGFSKIKANGGRAQSQNQPNITASQIRCKNAQHVTTKALEGGAHNTTTLAVGSRNESFPLSGITIDDKLLKGLLAPGFEEQSCLSRCQSYLFRRASPHRPSPYLISKLRNYEDLHKRCGLHTKSYNRTISKLMKSSNRISATMCKYLAWTAANGLGNRMISLVSAFLYAVLTNRVLLVEFGTDMVGLFCEPFPNSSWLLSKDFSHVIHQRNLQTFETMLKNDKGNKSEKLSPSFLDLNLQHGLHDDERLFHCDHGQDLLQKVPVLILRSDQYFVPYLFMIQSFKQELSKTFPEEDSVFLNLGRYLFHPSNQAWGLISKFYQTYLAKADERIGLQIRVFDVNHASHQSVMDEILACTLKNKLPPELDMKKPVNSQLTNQTMKAVQVASLHSEYSEKLKSMYLIKPTVTGEIVGVYQRSDEEHQEFNDKMHNIKAWSEIYLLSLCDVLVTSSNSTFGYVAQGLGGLKPWILPKAKPNGIRNPPCKRTMSMEPCFHYPPWHHCFANTLLNVTSVFPHLKHCEDFSFGVKLVNG